MNPLLEKLKAALQAAHDAGDMKLVSSLAKMVHDLEQGNVPAVDPNSTPPVPPETVTAATVPPVPQANTEPAEPAEGAPGPLYAAAQTQLEAMYPSHQFEDELEASVVIEVILEGASKYLEIVVTMADDGTATLGEATEVTPAGEPPESDAPPVLSITASASANQKRRSFVIHLDAATMASGPTWINIINLGTYQHEEYGQLEFTRERVEAWHRNLHAGVYGGTRNGKPCIATDYGHSMDLSVRADEQIASAYIFDLKIEGERVYALTEFTPKALEGIKAGEWSWFSISEVESILDQRTGQETGPVLRGGAITNRPFIPGLESIGQTINLSDLRGNTNPRITALERDVQTRDAEITRLRNEQFSASVTATRTALETAGIPRSVMTLALPLIEADFAATTTVQLSRNGRIEQVKPGAVIASALLEIAKVGIVPLGEKTKAPSDTSGVTLEQARAEIEVELEKAGRKNVRLTDRYAMARAKYPHLKEN
jgi:Mu-like prophage I protein